jgi:signal transduction histidine kinase
VRPVTGDGTAPPVRAARLPVQARRAIGDALLVAVLEALPGASLVHVAEGRWWVWVLSLALPLPLLARRRAPRVVFAAVCALALVQWVLDLRLLVDVALLVALYTVATRQPRRQAAAAAGVLEIGVVLASVRFSPAADGVVGSLVFLTGLVAAAVLLGVTVHARREHLAELEDRARRLERERDQQSRLAVTAERARIAREMHDIVAHSLAVMTTLADGALASAGREPELAVEAMRQVSATGRQALGDMRRLLGVLRDASEPAELLPQPSLAGLEDLLGQVRATGLAVRLNVTGAPQPLPPTEDATAYRVVQEALTNALKHARELSEVTVALAWSGSALDVEVRDDGALPAVGVGGGHGLVGMRERVGVFAGSLEAGPDAAGGWRLRARLPIGPAV